MRLKYLAFLLLSLNLFSQNPELTEKDVAMRKKLEPVKAEIVFEKKTYKTLSFKALQDFKLTIEDPYYAEKEEIPKLQKDIPDKILKLNKKSVEIKGFMFPLYYTNDGDVESFLLMPDQSSCCFGKFPYLNGLIFVQPDKPVKHLKDIPLQVFGSFDVGAKETAKDKVVTIYRIYANHVHKAKFKK